MYEFINKNGELSSSSAKVVVIDKYGKVKEVSVGGGAPSGPAGGDLSGTYPNPSVVWNNGTSTYNLLYYPLSSNPAGYLTTAVTSVGMTVPSAFNVTPSTITSTGTFAVTGAGLVSQYIRGDGTLANFPNSTGGGSSVNYYLNGSISQGVFGGDTYYQMSKTPILGAGTNFIRTNGAGNGYIASFITDVAEPIKLNITVGNWNLEFYFQSSSTGGSPQYYAEIYKVSVTNVFTLVATGSANPEGITNGTTVDQYFTSIPVPQTSLLITDRLAIRIYVITSGRTITLHTENGNLCEILTTFTTGLTALNGLTQQVQNLATGTSGTDFAINSTTATHTFNLPTASATNRGALSTTDWTTFNGKQDRVSGVSDTEISYLDGVTSSIQPQIDNLVELNFLRQNVGYIIPAGLVNIQPSFSVSPNLAGWGLSLQGNTATGGIGGFVRFDTTATAGTLAFRKGSFGIMLGGYQFEYTQKVRFQTNLTGQRGLWGLSPGYTYATPTNVEPNTNTSVVGVCQLSTSTNLHIIHNDASGTATTSDLGVNYPCNTNIYTYYIRIKRTLVDYTITVERITNTDNSSISTVYTTSTNIPAFSLTLFSPINYITNNAQSSVASYFDGGCIAKITHQ